MIKNLGNGRIEIFDKHRGHAVYVKSTDIICVRKDWTPEGTETACKVVFNPHSKTGLPEMLFDDYERRGQDPMPVPTMILDCTVDEFRIALREAVGMSVEEISEEMGLDLLGKVP